MDRLLEKLQNDKLINEDQARIVRIESALKAKPVRRVLMDADIVSVGELDRYHVDVHGLDLSAEDFIPDPEALAMLGEVEARRYNALPVAFDSVRSELMISMDDASNLVVRDRLRRAIPNHIDILFRRSEATELKRAIDKCYGVSHSLADILLELERQSVSTATVDSDHLEHTPVVRLIDAILQDAVVRRASDIHFSPRGLLVSVRYRIDGVLREACALHNCYWSAMLVRLKVLSNVDIAETRVPQDGHVTRLIHGQNIDFRVASFPIRSGENLVLRVLDRRRGIRSLSTLCDNTDTLHSLTSMVQRPNGLVVVCGPTGSGKTTTLYALLQSLNAAALNIMTLEDPVEYPLSNIQQTRVQPSSSFGFADGVRGILRQDPDVILIGEIRDKDSCVMACRAALTGHLVLTSTHANDCLSAISRLVELGAQQSVLASVLHGVVAQRLLRKKCNHCELQDNTCGVCGGAGYSGRIPLFEHLNVSNTFSGMLLQMAPEEQLLQQARTDGMISLLEQANEKVEQGLTTSTEIGRVLGVH